MKLETFDFNSMAVRVLEREGQPWFVAADVCRVLELTNAAMACDGLDEDEKGVSITDTLGGKQKMNIISESGLYALIFKSRKPQARAFRKWVTAEVLPALRRGGEYVLPTGAVVAADAAVEVVSVLSFVRERCVGWTLERQMSLGLMVRRYAKSMGVVFQRVEEPGVGPVFGFARPVLEAVRVTMAPVQAVLENAEAQELAALLRSLHEEHHGNVVLSAEEVRRAAVRMGLFPRVMKMRSESARQSAFGCLVARYAGHVFPGGYVVENLRTSSRRLYAIRQEQGTENGELRTENTTRRDRAA